MPLGWVMMACLMTATNSMGVAFGEDDPAVEAQKLHDGLANTYQQINQLNPLAHPNSKISPVPITDPIALKLKPLLQNPVTQTVAQIAQGNLLNDVWALISRVKDLQTFAAVEAGLIVAGMVSLLFIGKKSGFLMRQAMRGVGATLVLIIALVITPYFFIGVAWLDLIWAYLRPILAQY